MSKLKICPFCGGRHNKTKYGLYDFGFCAYAHSNGETLENYTGSIKNSKKKLISSKPKELKVKLERARNEANYDIDPMEQFKKLYCRKHGEMRAAYTFMGIAQVRFQNIFHGRALLKFSEGVALARYIAFLKKNMEKNNGSKR